MTTETIEWFTPEEKMPEENKPVQCVYNGYCSLYHYIYFNGAWEDVDGFKCGPPEFWSYTLKGPQ